MYDSQLTVVQCCFALMGPKKQNKQEVFFLWWMFLDFKASLLAF